MKKVQRLLCLMMTAAFLLGLFPADAFAQENAVKMYLTLVPVYGQAMSVEGIALDESGNAPADYDALRVAMYVVQPEWNNYWPMPLGRVYSDGHLSVSYDTATATDRESAQLEILLFRNVDSLPEGPSQANFESVRNQAIDALTITRTPEGGVTVTPERETPELDSPVSSTMFCLDVSFYTEEGSAPGSPLSEDLIREHLRVIRGFCDSIALYGAAHELEKIYPIAKNEFMFNKIVGTADLSSDEANNQQEYEALLNACRNGYVTTALLGNECLYSGKLSADKLIQYVTRFREELADDSIVIATSDNFDNLMAADAVCQALDEIWFNFYPVLGGSPAELAAGYLSRAAAQLKSKYPDKKIVARETGWPVSGTNITNSSAGTTAVLGADESARYFTDVRSWSIASATSVYWFSGFGEKWKSNVSGGKDYDSFWTLFSENLEMLDAFKNTGYFWEVSYDSNGGSGTMRNVMVSKGAAFTPFSCQFVAPDGQQFKVWEINGTEYQPDAQVTITANTTVKAIWENISPGVYAVTVNNGSGSGDYAENTSVTITANEPESGKQFKEWTGVDGLTFTDGSATTANATFTMPAKAVTVTATYEDIPATTYAVTVNNGSGSGEYAENASVTITANEPESGKQFKEWTGVDGLTFTDGSATTANATFTMPAKAVTVTATYEDIIEAEYDVTVNEGTGSGKYKAGDSVSISANAAPEGKVFDKWLGAEGVTFTNGNQNSASATFTMPGNNIDLTATFRTQTNDQGCYVATAVYGSYDCPEVWTLRRFRDNVLAKTWYGRLFIRLYYAVSPTAVKLFGNSEWFQSFFRDRLDKMVSDLQADGFASTPYQDRAW